MIQFQIQMTQKYCIDYTIVLCYVCACMCLTHVEHVVQVVPVCLRLSSVPFLQQSASVSYAALPFLGGSATHQDPLSLTPLTLGLMRNASSTVSAPPSLTSTTSKFLGCFGKYVKHHCLLWEVLSHPLHGIRARKQPQDQTKELL